MFFASFELENLAPRKDIFFIGEDSLIWIMHFEERVRFVSWSVVEIDPYFNDLRDITDCVYHFNFNELSLVDIVVDKFRKFSQLYFFLIVETKAIVLIENATVETFVVG